MHELGPAARALRRGHPAPSVPPSHAFGGGGILEEWMQIDGLANVSKENDL